MEGIVISFINMKGGVGKTTLSIGIADFLAEKGHPVLVIDSDPQFNATQALLDRYKTQDYYNENILKEHKTIYRLFKPPVDLCESPEIPKADELIFQLRNNLDIVCGDLTLVLANSSANHMLVKKIRNFIEDNRLKEKYEYIIIDCPPTLTIYTDSALMASDYYLIPNRIDRYSIVGITSLQKAIDSLIREERIKLRCLGLVYTMVDSKLAKQESLRIDFESKAEVGAIDIFTSRMHVTNDIQNGKSGPLPTQYVRSKEDIEAITFELVQKIEENRKDV